MKGYFRTIKWLRWAVAGAFGLMLVLNIMVSLEFERGNYFPSLTLAELGNMAFAQGEGGDGGDWFWQSNQTSITCQRQVCWIPGIMCDTFNGNKVECIDGWSWCMAYCNA
ncbi:hypothetical protein ADIS_2819 [Lunatimonas lonarensis]|uniref:Uncharacterized protein n=1 Tax=Lunatimonas lonarensis TaxID=1232681 RepID=R7ZRM8_9BACT|nr:hypothetical protein [Lunatimonas lonarensis]EON76703.1 hypothetical protein ADIS_2819 [Lunatimonas lonarensis]